MMFVADLFTHNLRQGTCPAWVIKRAPESERQRIHAHMSQLCAYEQDAGFNEWHIICLGHDHYMASRFTWDMGGYEGTLDHVLERITNYYSK